MCAATRWRLFLRALSLVLSPVLSLCSGARAVAAQGARPVLATADTGTTVIVECRIGDVASDVVEARTHGDTLFLPAAALLTLAGLDATAISGDLSLATLSTLFHAAVTFDATALVVQVADSGMLPVSRRAARSRARSRLHERELATHDVAAPARLARLPAAVVIGYAVQRDGAITLDAISRALGGVLNASLTRGAHAMHPAISWARVPSTVDGMSVRLGALDELAGGTGLLVTNAPLRPEDTVGVTSTAIAGAGTEVELFEDGILVAADSVATDAVRLRVARRRGLHVKRLVIHDPSGTEREARWIESVPDALLPRGAVRYTVAAGRCARSSCTAGAAGVASVAYAPAERITVAARLTPGMHSSVTRRHPSLRASLDARLTAASALSVQTDPAGSVVAELRVDRERGRAFVVRSVGAGVPAASPLLPARLGFAHRLTTATGSWRMPGAGSLDLATGFSRTGAAIASAASVPLPFAIVQGVASVERERGMPPCGGLGGGALVYGGWLARVLGRLRASLVRVRAEHRGARCGGVSRNVLVVLPTSVTSAIELSATWGGASRSGPALSVALRRQIGDIMSAHAEVSGGDGPHTTRSGVAGSVTLDALRRSASFGVDPAGASALVEGVLYVDDDANGRRDAGERVVAGAVVRSGDATAVSDDRGIFVLPGLVPNQVARLSVDSLSVEDAGYAPTAPVSVMLTARAVVHVDIAVRPRSASTP